MKYSLFVILILALVISSCSPVRKEYFNGYRPLSRQVSLKEQKNAASENTNKIKAKPQKAKSKNVMDTTYIFLNSSSQKTDEINVGSGKYSDEYKSAMADFDMEKYESACERLRKISNKLNEDDPLNLEIKYQLCECEIINGHLDAAEQMLKGLISAQRLTENIRQKAMVSIGQVYCMQNKTRLAEEMFERLKTQYPESHYLPFANCESAGKH